MAKNIKLKEKDPVHTYWLTLVLWDYLLQWLWPMQCLIVTPKSIIYTQMFIPAQFSFTCWTKEKQMSLLILLNWNLDCFSVWLQYECTVYCSFLMYFIYDKNRIAPGAKSFCYLWKMWLCSYWSRNASKIYIYNQKCGRLGLHCIYDNNTWHLYLSENVFNIPKSL